MVKKNLLLVWLAVFLALLATGNLKLVFHVKKGRELQRWHKIVRGGGGGEAMQ